MQLVRESGHPRHSLPLLVDLFAIPDSVPVLSRLWRFYASKGVRTHPLFKDHHDFYQPENAQELAQALEQVLQQGERHLSGVQECLAPSPDAADPERCGCGPANVTGAIDRTTAALEA